MKKRMNKGRGKERRKEGRKVGWQAEGAGQNTYILPFNKCNIGFK
jgi:hypothetical protein